MVKAEGPHLELVEPQNQPFIGRVSAKAHRLTIGRLIRALAHDPRYYDLEKLSEEELNDLLAMSPTLFTKWWLHSGSVDGYIAALLRDAIAGKGGEKQGLNVNVTQAVPVQSGGDETGRRRSLI